MSNRVFRIVALAFLASAAIASKAIGQASVSGLVRDSAGLPIVGAQVNLAGVAKVVLSGRRGDFQFIGVSLGQHLLRVRQVGYVAHQATVDVVDGDNRIADIVLARTSVPLDTVAIRDQQILRENPLLRDFEENRKVGLGQFVTRAQLQAIQGGYISQVFNQMRGMTVVRGTMLAGRAWIANTQKPPRACTELEDLDKDVPSPNHAGCLFCFPQVYLDYTRLSTDRRAPNVNQFSPDALEAVEVYLGASETPARYSSGFSDACGVIVFHTRVFQAGPKRVVARVGDAPTRSHLFVSASLARATFGDSCADCTAGAATDVIVGYTLGDRFVVGGRYLRSVASQGGNQTATIGQLVTEWYLHPEPARVKWFVQTGVGVMSLALHTTHGADRTDAIRGSAFPTFTVATGTDIAIVRRIVASPFASYASTIGGTASHQQCLTGYDNAGVRTTTCGTYLFEPQYFHMIQFGTRVGWR